MLAKENPCFHILRRVEPFFGDARILAVHKRRSLAQRPCVTPLETRALLAASFEGLGPDTTATAVSADASVVVGNHQVYGGPFYWTQSAGVVLLHDSSGNTLGIFSKATGVSGDASVIVGGSTSAGGQAFRWANGVAEPISQLPSSQSSIANSVSADGSIIAGDIQTSTTTSGFTLTGTNLESVPPASMNLTTRGTIISANGAVVAGNIINGFGTSTAYQSMGGVFIQWPDSTGLGSSATAISPDGSVVVGSRGVGNAGGDAPFEWTDGAVTTLALPTGFTTGSAMGVSNDGTTIVGSMSTNGLYSTAFIWTQANGVQNLQQVLTADYGLSSSLTGWTLSEATAITPDGNTIVGNGVDPQGQDEGWIVQVNPPPPPPPPPPPNGTSTSLQASSLSPVSGQPVTLTATVQPASGVSGIPAGTVSFLDGATSLGTAQLNDGTASLSISDLPVGSDPILASFSGNSQFTGSGSLAEDVIVRKDGTSVAISSSAGSVDVGQSITFLAMVDPDAPGSGTPTGTVTFRDGDVTLGTAPLSGGQAVLTTTLTSGPHEISAVYAGDGNFDLNTSGLLGETVFAQRYNTVTHVKEKRRSSSFGQTVTFSATVASTSAFGGTPTGKAFLMYEGNVLETAQLESGRATFAIASLPGGFDNIYVYYDGDVTFSSSTSKALAEVVAQERTRTQMTSSRYPSSVGQPITLTVHVNPAGKGGAIPTGSVTFSDGSTILETVPLSDGSTSLTTSLLSVGKHSLRVRYTGSTDFATSSSPVLRQRVTQSAPTAFRLILER